MPFGQRHSSAHLSARTRRRHPGVAVLHYVRGAARGFNRTGTSAGHGVGSGAIHTLTAACGIGAAALCTSGIAGVIGARPNRAVALCARAGTGCIRNDASRSSVRARAVGATHLHIRAARRTHACYSSVAVQFGPPARRLPALRR
jgi:hypothetical protein